MRGRRGVSFWDEKDFADRPLRRPVGHSELLPADSGPFELIAARRLLESECAALAARHAVMPRTVALDFSRPGAPDELLARVADIEVGLLVYNAARLRDAGQPFVLEAAMAKLAGKAEGGAINAMVKAKLSG